MTERDRASDIAAAVLTFRRQRGQFFSPELFAEPSWDLLLELFVADAKGAKLTAREVCERSKIPQAVMSRWLIHLTLLGIVVGDGDGNIDDQLSLSGDGLSRMEELMRVADVLRLINNSTAC